MDLPAVGLPHNMIVLLNSRRSITIMVMGILSVHQGAFQAPPRFAIPNVELLVESELLIF